MLRNSLHKIITIMLAATWPACGVLGEVGAEPVRIEEVEPAL